MTARKMVRFKPVEIRSLVWFMNGQEKCSNYKVVSYKLIPTYRTGLPVPVEIPFPEIFLQ